jgi:DNA primase
MQTLVAGQDINDAKTKGRIAAQVLPLIDDVENPIERENYRQSLAHLLRVDERALINTRVVPVQLRRTRRSEAQPPSAARPDSAAFFQASPGPQLERYALTLLLRLPETLHSLDRLLQEAGLPRLEASDFSQTEHQLIFQLLQNALNQIELDPQEYIQDHHDPSLTPGLDGFLHAAIPEGEPEEKLFADLAQVVLRLRRINTNEKVNQLQFLVLEAVQDGQMRVAAYEEEAARLGQLRNLLDHALDQTSIRK